MISFAGHKGLKGFSGSGFLYKHPDIHLNPLMTGGTGGDSGLFDIGSYKKPTSYEVGT
jgi:selenocysteine lyase/cysteine desulfurase